MISTTWGLLGPERLAPERRARSLGLTSVVRTFNDLAVPGLGNVFFGKQLFLALLGIAVASRARALGARRVANIETANAIEALACWIGLEKIDWQLDARLRGRIKLDRSYGQSFPFSVLKRPSYYVSHPMRQATSSALVDLKLVESTGRLFNSFECSEIGMHFLELVIGRKLPDRMTFIDYLAKWVLGGNSGSSVIDDVLSPVDEMPPVACSFLRSLLCQNERRRNLFAWMKAIDASASYKISWDNKPLELDAGHWQDLQVGAMFFATRDAALRVLLKLEQQIANSSYRDLKTTDSLSFDLECALTELRAAANRFLSASDVAASGQIALKFCRECSHSSAPEVLRSLVERDGRILIMRDGKVHVSGSFNGRPIESNEETGLSDEGAEAEVPDRIEWPTGISRRVNNFYFLNLDLDGRWPVTRE